MNGNRATCRLGNLYAGLPITGKSSMVRLVALLSCAGVGLVLSLQASPPQGVVVGWGDNSFGQCSVPADLRSVVSVAAGYDHALALRADGTVVGWGQTWFNAATPPPSLSNIIAIAAGTQTSVALRSDGTAVTWGRYGSISGLTGLQAISSGYSHTVGLRSNGTIIAWGDNSRGQTAVPAGLTNVLAVAAGTYHSLAIKHDGTVVGWGRNDYGQCNPPPDLTNAVAVAGGNYHSMALRSDGTVVCWGTNWAFGDIANQNIAPPGLSNVVAITAGAYHNLAIRADGSLVAWGWAGYGVNTVPDSLSGVVGCSAALSYNLAVTTKPFITAQPADVSAHLGAPASFAVSCVGNQPFAYQWELGGTNLPGATNAQLNLPSVRGSDAGEFRVVVSNSGGSTTSHVAQLEILLSPSATICPDSALVLLGGKVQYDAQAYGQNPLSLRWQFNGADLPSAASPSLILSNILASQAGAYTLAVTNGLGSVISPPASLTGTEPSAGPSLGPILEWRTQRSKRPKRGGCPGGRPRPRVSPSEKRNRGCMGHELYGTNRRAAWTFQRRRHFRWSGIQPGVKARRHLGRMGRLWARHSPSSRLDERGGCGRGPRSRRGSAANRYSSHLGDHCEHACRLERSHGGGGW